MKVLFLFVAVAVASGVCFAQQKIQVDGSPVKFDVDPQLLNGRLMVPMRSVFDKMGVSIEWLPERDLIIARKGSDKVELVMNSRTVRINGKEEQLEQAPYVFEGRTMVPLRLIAQATGSMVSYEDGWVKIQTAKKK